MGFYEFQSYGRKVIKSGSRHKNCCIYLFIYLNYISSKVYKYIKNKSVIKVGPLIENKYKIKNR